VCCSAEGGAAHAALPPSFAWILVKGANLFSSAVVLVATSMNDSDERSDEESGAGSPHGLDPLPQTLRGVYPELCRRARGDIFQGTLGARLWMGEGQDGGEGIVQDAPRGRRLYWSGNLRREAGPALPDPVARGRMGCQPVTGRRRAFLRTLRRVIP